MSSAGADPRGTGPGVATLGATRRLIWLLVVPVLALLALLTALQYEERLADAARELQRRADEHAQELEAWSRPASSHVDDLHALLASHWHAPPDPGPELARLMTRHRAQGRDDGWSLDDADPAQRARHGQFWWESADGRQPDPLWTRRAALFNGLARVVHGRDPAFAATWFAAGDENTSFGYPWVATASMLRTMGAGSLREIDGPRQRGVERAQEELRRDPLPPPFWGPPYVSQLDGQLVLSHGRMLVVDGRYVGEVSVDFRLDPLQERLSRWTPPGLAWVVDREGRILADAHQPLRRPPGEGLADTRVLAGLEQRLPAPLRGQWGAGGRVASPAWHGDWLLVAGSRAGAPWSFVQAVPRSVLRAQVLPTLRPNALLGGFLLFVFLAGQWWLARRVVDPALAVLDYLRRAARDPQAMPPPLSGRWRPWVDAVTDVFARQREALQGERRSQIFKAAIVDHAVSGIVTTDADGHIVEFNPLAERLFGITRDRAVGQRLGELLVPLRHRAAHQALMKRLLAGEAIPGVGHPTEMVGLRGDGSEFPMEMLVTRIEVDGQSFFTGFMTDISERQAAARQIERQREALRQSEKLSAMGALLASVAHELNNPLAIVVGRSSLLEERPLPAAAADDVRRIRDAAERCGRIVRTFLAMARQRPMQRGRVQLADLMRAAADMLGYTLRSQGIELSLDLPADLPEVQADGDQIGQVLLSLLVNAQQALSGVEGRRMVNVQAGHEPAVAGRAAAAGQVWLRVVDNGPGVPASAREQLFEPFFTASPERFGTGMGLALSRSMLREHGGDLVVEDGPGGRFRLSLPLHLPAAGRPADPSG